MEKVKPMYINFLIAAIIIFVIGVSMALSDLYNKVGALEEMRAEEDFAHSVHMHHHK